MDLFKANTSTDLFFKDSVAASNRGKSISLGDMYGNTFTNRLVNDSVLHDANFAFLSTTLSKVHEELVEPKHFTTYLNDIPVNVGGGFVDYVTYYTVDWSGIMNEYRNIMGNSSNIIPRVNAGLSQKRVNVFTYEVAYDLRFIELEKAKQLTLKKSIQDIYKNIIIAGWDLFAQKIAYVGTNNSSGLFNSKNVKIITIDNGNSTSKGFIGMSDKDIVSFFNGVFELYLLNSNSNISLLPDTFLVPTFVGLDLSSRFSEIYTSTLRKFLTTHNLAVDESDDMLKSISISSRQELNTLGSTGHGRIVAYKKDESYVRLDIPYPIQHYITLPNIERMSYTSAFVGQISEIQLPYNTSSNEFGVVTYWDFIK